MLIGDYFNEVSRSLHEHQTAGFIRSSDLFTDARSDDLGYLRATLTFHDGSELPLPEYVRISGGVTLRLAFAYHYQLLRPTAATEALLTATQKTLPRRRVSRKGR